MSDPTVPYQVLLRPYPQYADGSIGDYLAPPNNGNSIYHSAQFKFEKRFSHGVSILAHYTISKLITDSDSNSSDTEWLNSIPIHMARRRGHCRTIERPEQRAAI
jgi:hypothetical protein